LPTTIDQGKAIYGLLFQKGAMQFFIELRRRNQILFWFGLANFLAGLCCLVLTQIDKTIILGINAWIKPMKFYISIWIMSWSMGWLLFHLQQERKVKIYSWIVVISLILEMIAITGQSARGITSHFNITSPLNILIFNIMGISILIFVLSTAWICYLFFKKKDFAISKHYVWAIRLGILFFVLFSLEGGLMLGFMRHTIGAPDGGPGLPIVNWSKRHGDLRIAHLFGMHSLQIIPLVGYYLTSNLKQVLLFATLYFVMVTIFLIQALNGVPLF
jgi:hypothetical protein